uniref:Uncharacterized protein n=1 Tax=Arundo donax TaxID=35708 RepID=A0A0A9FQP9_ARUDO
MVLLLLLELQESTRYRVHIN